MTKPEKFYWVKAQPSDTGSGFVGVYAAPGLNAGIVRDADGKPARFPNETQAEFAAHQRLIEVLNSLPALARKNGGKQEKYLKPTGPEFAELLAEAEITPTAFAYITSQKLSRIQEWIQGLDEKGNATAAPHWARVMLVIFRRFPETFDFSLKVTDEYTTKD